MCCTQSVCHTANVQLLCFLIEFNHRLVCWPWVYDQEGMFLDGLHNAFGGKPKSGFCSLWHSLTTGLLAPDSGEADIAMSAARKRNQFMPGRKVLSGLSEWQLVRSQRVSGITSREA